MKNIKKTLVCISYLSCLLSSHRLHLCHSWLVGTRNPPSKARSKRPARQDRVGIAPTVQRLQTIRGLLLLVRHLLSQIFLLLLVPHLLVQRHLPIPFNARRLRIRLQLRNGGTRAKGRLQLPQSSSSVPTRNPKQSLQLEIHSRRQTEDCSMPMMALHLEIQHSIV